MKNHRFLNATLSALTLAAVLASAGCQGQTDKDTIGAAPPTAAGAKAPSPVANKPGAVGGGDGASGGGGSASTTEAAPVPATGP